MEAPLLSKCKVLYCIMCHVSQVFVALVIFMHGGDVKLFLPPCAFMLNYAYNGSAMLGWNIVSPLPKIRCFLFQEPTGQLCVTRLNLGLRLFQ